MNKLVLPLLCLLLIIQVVISKKKDSVQAEGPRKIDDYDYDDYRDDVSMRFPRSYKKMFEIGFIQRSN